MKTLRIACLSVAALVFVAAGPPALLDLVRETRAARLRGDRESWLRAGRAALALAPDHPDLLISVARAEAANQDLDSAARHLGDAIRRGAGFSFSDLPEVAPLVTTAPFAKLVAAAQKNAVPVAAARIVTQIDDEGLRPEGITYDPRTRRLFIGSIRGEIWTVDESGHASLFLHDNGLREVLGLKIDAERRLLWAITGVFPDLLNFGVAPKPDVGITGVVAFDADTAQKVAGQMMDERPQLHGFNDLTLAKDGRVFITDSATGSVYVMNGVRGVLERFVHDEHFTFANGIVITPDQRTIYVATAEGLTGVDTRTRRTTRVRVPPDGAVNSIDGLDYDRGSLIGVQSSPYLSRQIRIRLNARGDAVRSVETLNSRTPPAVSATTCVVVGDELFVVAGSGAPPAAQPSATRPQIRPTIFRVPLRGGA